MTRSLAYERFQGLRWMGLAIEKIPSDPNEAESPLDLTTVATILGVSTERVRQMCGSGRLTHRKVALGPRKHRYEIEVESVRQEVRRRGDGGLDTGDLRRELLIAKVHELEVEVAVQVALRHDQEATIARLRAEVGRLRAAVRTLVADDH